MFLCFLLDHFELRERKSWRHGAKKNRWRLRTLAQEGFSGGAMGDRQNLMESKTICSFFFTL
jgi:hypothetical protein